MNFKRFMRRYLIVAAVVLFDLVWLLINYPWRPDYEVVSVPVNDVLVMSLDGEPEDYYAKQINTRTKGIEDRHEHQKERKHAKKDTKKKWENRDENKRYSKNCYKSLLRKDAIVMCIENHFGRPIAADCVIGATIVGVD